jgi:methyl-accepting chemotaxis protein
MSANDYDTSVVRFTPRHAEVDQSDNQVDQVGAALLELVDKAAEVAESNNRQAMERARRLANDLRVAEETIRQLEGEMAGIQERADRAEEWMHRVYTEIETRFLHTEKRRATAR